jgi:hypothetical protein
MEEEGLLKRKQYSSQPARYAYYATPKSKELDRVTLALRGWMLRWGCTQAPWRASIQNSSLENGTGDRWTLAGSARGSTIYLRRCRRIAERSVLARNAKPGASRSKPASSAQQQSASAAAPKLDRLQRIPAQARFAKLPSKRRNPRSQAGKAGKNSNKGTACRKNLRVAINKQILRVAGSIAS